MNIIENKKTKNVIRVIAIALIVSFIAYDISWAYPDGFRKPSSSDTLAPSPFLRDKTSPERCLAALASILEDHVFKVIQQEKVTFNAMRAGFEKFKIESFVSSGLDHYSGSHEFGIKFPSGYVLRYCNYNPETAHENDIIIGGKKEKIESVIGTYKLNDSLYKQLMRVSVEAKDLTPLDVKRSEETPVAKFAEDLAEKIHIERWLDGMHRLGKSDASREEIAEIIDEARMMIDESGGDGFRSRCEYESIDVGPFTIYEIRPPVGGNIHLFKQKNDPGGKYVMIDTGLGAYYGEVVDYLKNRLNIDPANDIAEIWLTHMDIDHTGSAERFRVDYGINIRVHGDYSKALKNRIPSSPINETYTQLIGPLTRFTALGSLEGKKAGSIECFQEKLEERPDIDLPGGLEPVDKINTSGNAVFYVIPLKGHTMDSVCFLYKDKDAKETIIFSGDIGSNFNEIREKGGKDWKFIEHMNRMLYGDTENDRALAKSQAVTLKKIPDVYLFAGHGAENSPSNKINKGVVNAIIPSFKTMVLLVSVFIVSGNSAGAILAIESLMGATVIHHMGHGHGIMGLRFEGIEKKPGVANFIERILFRRVTDSGGTQMSYDSIAAGPRWNLWTSLIALGLYMFFGGYPLLHFGIANLVLGVLNGMSIQSLDTDGWKIRRTESPQEDIVKSDTPVKKAPPLILEEMPIPIIRQKKPHKAVSKPEPRRLPGSFIEKVPNTGTAYRNIKDALEKGVLPKRTPILKFGFYDDIGIFAEQMGGEICWIYPLWTKAGELNIINEKSYLPILQEPERLDHFKLPVVIVINSDYFSLNSSFSYSSGHKPSEDQMRSTAKRVRESIDSKKIKVAKIFFVPTHGEPNELIEKIIHEEFEDLAYAGSGKEKTTKIPGMLDVEKDKRVDPRFRKRLLARARPLVRQESEELTGKAISLVNKDGKNVRQIVEIRILEHEPYFGIRRFDGAGSDLLINQDLIVGKRIGTQKGNKLVLYMTKTFYYKYVRHNHILLADRIWHEYQEHFRSKTHREASKSIWERKYLDKKTGLPVFLKTFADLAIGLSKKELGMMEHLRKLVSSSHPNDKGGKFRKYLAWKLASHELPGLSRSLARWINSKFYTKPESLPKRLTTSMPVIIIIMTAMLLFTIFFDDNFVPILGFGSDIIVIAVGGLVAMFNDLISQYISNRQIYSWGQTKYAFFLDSFIWVQYTLLFKYLNWASGSIACKSLFLACGSFIFAIEYALLVSLKAKKDKAYSFDEECKKLVDLFFIMFAFYYFSNVFFYNLKMNNSVAEKTIMMLIVLRGIPTDIISFIIMNTIKPVLGIWDKVIEPLLLGARNRIIKRLVNAIFKRKDRAKLYDSSDEVTSKYVGIDGFDEDNNANRDFRKDLLAKAKKLENVELEGKLNEALKLIKDREANAPPIDVKNIELMILEDEPYLGIRRHENAASLTEQDILVGEKDKDTGKLILYITRRFYGEYLKDNPLLLLDRVGHEYQEEFEHKSHAEACKSIWRYTVNDDGVDIPVFLKVCVDMAIKEADPAAIEHLKKLADNRNHENDKENRFSDYINKKREEKAKEILGIQNRLNLSLIACSMKSMRRATELSREMIDGIKLFFDKANEYKSALDLKKDLFKYKDRLEDDIAAANKAISYYGENEEDVLYLIDCLEKISGELDKKSPSELPPLSRPKERTYAEKTSDKNPQPDLVKISEDYFDDPALKAGKGMLERAGEELKTYKELKQRVISEAVNRLRKIIRDNGIYVSTSAALDGFTDDMIDRIVSNIVRKDARIEEYLKDEKRLTSHDRLADGVLERIWRYISEEADKLKKTEGFLPSEYFMKTLLATEEEASSRQLLKEVKLPALIVCSAFIDIAYRSSRPKEVWKGREVLLSGEGLTEEQDQCLKKAFALMFEKKKMPKPMQVGGELYILIDPMKEFRELHELKETSPPGVKIYAINDDTLFNEILPEITKDENIISYLKDYFVSHAGTYQGQVQNIFILKSRLRKLVRASFDARCQWAHHEAEHIKAIAAYRKDGVPIPSEDEIRKIAPVSILIKELVNIKFPKMLVALVEDLKQAVEGKDEKGVDMIRDRIARLTGKEEAIAIVEIVRQFNNNTGEASAGVTIAEREKTILEIYCRHRLYRHSDYKTWLIPLLYLASLSSKVKLHMAVEALFYVLAENPSYFASQSPQVTTNTFGRNVGFVDPAYKLTDRIIRRLGLVPTPDLEKIFSDFKGFEPIFDDIRRVVKELYPYQIKFTANHSVRLAYIGMCLLNMMYNGEKIIFKEDEIGDYIIAAFIHDLGKAASTSLNIFALEKIEAGCRIPIYDFWAGIKIENGRVAIDPNKNREVQYIPESEIGLSWKEFEIKINGSTVPVRIKRDVEKKYYIESPVDMIRLVEVPRPLSGEEAAIVTEIHPMESIRMLEAAGITPPEAVKLGVLYHHNRKPVSEIQDEKLRAKVKKITELISMLDIIDASQDYTRPYRLGLLPETVEEVLESLRGNIDPNVLGWFGKAISPGSKYREEILSIFRETESFRGLYHAVSLEQMLRPIALFGIRAELSRFRIMEKYYEQDLNKINRIIMNMMFDPKIAAGMTEDIIRDENLQNLAQKLKLKDSVITLVINAINSVTAASGDILTPEMISSYLENLSPDLKDKVLAGMAETGLTLLSGNGDSGHFLSEEAKKLLNSLIHYHDFQDGLPLFISGVDASLAKNVLEKILSHRDKDSVICMDFRGWVKLVKEVGFKELMKLTKNGKDLFIYGFSPESGEYTLKDTMRAAMAMRTLWNMGNLKQIIVISKDEYDNSIYPDEERGSEVFPFNSDFCSYIHYIKEEGLTKYAPRWYKFYKPHFGDEETRIIKKLGRIADSDFMEREKARPYLFSLLNNESRIIQDKVLSILRNTVDKEVPLVEDLSPYMPDNDTVLTREDVDEFFFKLLPTLSGFSFIEGSYERIARFHILGIPFYVSRDPITGFMFNEARPGREFLNLIYSNWYMRSPLPEHLGFRDNTTFSEAQHTKESGIRCDEIMSLFEKYFGSLAKDKFVDVGAGASRVARELKNRGWGEAIVVEPNPEGREIQKTLNVDEIHTDIKDLIKQKEKFNLVTCVAVLEHVVDPEEFLKNLAEITEEGGMLFLRIPRTPPEGPSLVCMEHLNHFNEDSIRLFLKSAGFEPLEIIDSPIIQSTGKLDVMAVVARRGKHDIAPAAVSNEVPFRFEEAAYEMMPDTRRLLKKLGVEDEDRVLGDALDYIKGVFGKVERKEWDDIIRLYPEARKLFEEGDIIQTMRMFEFSKCLLPTAVLYEDGYLEINKHFVELVAYLRLAGMGKVLLNDPDTGKETNLLESIICSLALHEIRGHFNFKKDKYIKEKIYKIFEESESAAQSERGRNYFTLNVAAMLFYWLSIVEHHEGKELEKRAKGFLARYRKEFYGKLGKGEDEDLVKKRKRILAALRDIDKRPEIAALRRSMFVYKQTGTDSIENHDRVAAATKQRGQARVMNEGAQTAEKILVNGMSRAIPMEKLQQPKAYDYKDKISTFYEDDGRKLSDTQLSTSYSTCTVCVLMTDKSAYLLHFMEPYKVSKVLDIAKTDIEDSKNLRLIFLPNRISSAVSVGIYKEVSSYFEEMKKHPEEIFLKFPYEYKRYESMGYDKTAVLAPSHKLTIECRRGFSETSEMFGYDLPRPSLDAKVKMISEIEPINLPPGMNITAREQLEKIIEEPLLEACKILYDKGIKTFTSSANRYDIKSGAYIKLDLDSLSPENRVVAGRICGGIAKDELWIPITKDMPVEEVSKAAIALANQFSEQLPGMEDIRNLDKLMREGEMAKLIEQGFKFYLSENLFRPEDIVTLRASLNENIIKIMNPEAIRNLAMNNGTEKNKIGCIVTKNDLKGYWNGGSHKNNNKAVMLAIDISEEMESHDKDYAYLYVEGLLGLISAMAIKEKDRTRISLYMSRLFKEDKMNEAALEEYLKDDDSMKFALSVMLKLKPSEKIDVKRFGDYKKNIETLLINA